MGVTSRAECPQPTQGANIVPIFECHGAVPRYADLKVDSPYDPATVQGFLESAVCLSRDLPIEIGDALDLVTAGRPKSGCVLLRGCIPAGLTIGPTPLGWRAHPRVDHSFVPELILTTILTRIGQPFAFRSQHDGRLIQNICPSPGQELDQTSWGSKVFLEWHVEDAFSDQRCNFFGLLCLREDLAVSTFTSSLRAVTLGPHHDAVLREERFFVRPDDSHEDLAMRRTVTILEGTKDDPQMRFDPLYTGVLRRDDNEAIESLQYLHTQIKSAAISTTLHAGDLLIIDNRRVAHARSSFDARYDGTDRWLQRLGVWETHGGCREWLIADTNR